MKGLYNKSFEKLKKEIREDIRRWKETPYLWIGRINNVKMTIFLNQPIDSMQYH